MLASVAHGVMLGALVTMVAVWKAPETFRRDLRATSAAPVGERSGA